MKKDNTHIIDELKELEAENLLNIKHSKGSIPENYFENLNGQIFEKVKIEEKSKQTSFKRFLLPFSIAASVLLLISINMFYSNEISDTTTWNNISFIELENYINENIEDFSDEELASLSFKGNSILEFSNESLDKDLIDYLMESNMSEEEMF